MKSFQRQRKQIVSSGKTSMGQCKKNTAPYQVVTKPVITPKLVQTKTHPTSNKIV